MDARKPDLPERPILSTWNALSQNEFLVRLMSSRVERIQKHLDANTCDHAALRRDVRMLVRAAEGCVGARTDLERSVER